MNDICVVLATFGRSCDFEQYMEVAMLMLLAMADTAIVALVVGLYFCVSVGEDSPLFGEEP
jgi:hypothetical protein